MANQLSDKQRWQLAVTLLLLYYPVILYIDLPVYAVNGEIPSAMVFHEAITVVVVFFIFYCWIFASDKIIGVLLKRYSESFFLTFNLKAQAITFMMALIMGFSFVFISGKILGMVNDITRSIGGASFLVPFPENHSTEFWDLYKRTNIGFFLLLMLSAFYLIANRRASIRIEEAQFLAERLEKEKSLMQLSALRNQVNPHFLFNSLSILNSIVDEDVKMSKEFIQQLSKFYRYTLDTANEDTVALKVEVDFIQAYNYLLMIRFEDKLKINLNITREDLTRHQIAPLTLQLLIENAVKHNQMSKERPLVIDVVVNGENIIVTNNLQPRTQRESSTRKGLQNIMDRYKLLTHRPVTVEDRADRFVVNIPLLNTSMI